MTNIAVDSFLEQAICKVKPESTTSNDVQAALWVLGGEDLEMRAIKHILQLHGQHWHQKETKWGNHFYTPTDLGLSMWEEHSHDGGRRSTVAGYEQVIFIECVPVAGEWHTTRTHIIDHHGDRSTQAASITQVVKQLSDMGFTFSDRTRRYCELVALNDAGHIPAMEWMGATPKEIAWIRKLDRKAQGISPLQEAQAREAIEKRSTNGRLTVVKLEHSKTASITDRLFGIYDQLLIVSKDGESNFFGDGALCAKLDLQFAGGWCGGSGLGKIGESAYWGNGKADSTQVLQFIKDNLT